MLFALLRQNVSDMMIHAGIEIDYFDVARSDKCSRCHIVCQDRTVNNVIVSI